MSIRIQRESEVTPAVAGRRLDQAAAELFPDFSRSRLQRWIRDGRLTVDHATRAPREPVREGERLRLDAEVEPEGDWQPVEMALRIIHEDADILVIDKPTGLVVHPAAGHADDTLLNGLLARYPELAQVPRAGIVHRLDRDTTGLLVVARTLAAQTVLVAAMQRHDVSREYRAIVNGVPISGRTIDRPLGRHPRDRQRMAVLEAGGREAVTHYRVLERYRAHALLQVQLETGRTHQIRVHLAEAGFPVTGDPAYGGRVRLPKHPTPELTACLRGFGRQALHAFRLSFVHPGSGETVAFEAPMPEDMEALLATLRADRDEGGDVP
jgi:23S rRNA pseudouridine1911/1915/1917 synthase